MSSVQKPKTWFARLEPYRQAKNGRAIFELLLTALLFFSVWGCIWGALQFNQYWALLGVIPGGGLIIRLFIIQHDCGHGSMFSSKWMNNWVGRIIGILTLTPYDHWRQGHAQHHASSGNLDRRGIGDDISTLTVDEYNGLSGFGRLKYRLYRNPFIMFGLGPTYVFFIIHRFPTGKSKSRVMPWVSTLTTNVGIFLFYALLIYTFGLKSVLLIQIPILIIGATIGVWMFYIQHQFENTHWSCTKEWDRETAALAGSSYYDLPKPIMWLTGHIGVHHVHHLSSRIPFYNLPHILKAHPELKQISRLTFLQSLKCVRVALWCERTKKMISFARYKTLSAPS